ncbi:universal stress protein [Natrialbaceae archaeon GCM10025810]|uniref:universal stress protein n=1 Tax=Halovalidus salilacus TaxID=3075124 RepID=UPI00361B692C
MSERILVPYDGSVPAKEALEYAFEMFSEATVTALYVVPIPEDYWTAFGEAGDLDLDRGRERGAEVLEGAPAIADERDRELETDVETGKPDRVIVERIEDEGFDTVVIGSHGREGVSRILLGSVAEKVVRRSPAPVVVVR